MDPQILVFLLLIAGISLIFAELFLPSGGMIAVICICCFLGSGYFAYRAWYTSQPIYWWIYIGSVAVLIPASVIGAFQLLANTSLGNRVLLAAPSEDEVTPYQREQEHLSGLIGERGTALNLMTPGGLVKVQGERLHAVSDGLMIEPNTTIEIVAVRGTRVVVRPVDDDPAASDLVADFAEDEDETPAEDAEDIDPWTHGESPG